MHMTNKELTIRQIGEFCTNTLCKKCPVAKWNEESNLHNRCMESLRLPKTTLSKKQFAKTKILSIFATANRNYSADVA